MGKTLFKNFLGQDSSFKRVTPLGTKNLTKCFDSNKAVGIDTIPPKLITDAAFYTEVTTHMKIYN